MIRLDLYTGQFCNKLYINALITYTLYMINAYAMLLSHIRIKLTLQFHIH